MFNIVITSLNLFVFIIFLYSVYLSFTHVNKKSNYRFYKNENDLRNKYKEYDM